MSGEHRVRGGGGGGRAVVEGGGGPRHETEEEVAEGRYSVEERRGRKRKQSCRDCSLDAIEGKG